MGLKETVMADVKSAMIAKETLKLETLRFLQAALKNREIDLRPNPMSDEEALGVLKKLVKQRKESIEQFQTAGRADLVEKEQKELGFLEGYLPAQLGRDQISAIVADVIKAVGATSVKDMGKVMKEVQARTSGSADNKVVSEVIREKLQ